jgi:hypothetical protein
MAIKKGQQFINKSVCFITSEPTKQNYRVNKTDFTRDRKMTFDLLVLFMLKSLRRNISLELNTFFSEIGQKVKTVTASAFIQNRRKIKPDLFCDLNKLIETEFYTDNDENILLYKGMRILSIDGSRIALPNTINLAKTYGYTNNQYQTNDKVHARISVLYDVLNEIVIDGLMRPLIEGEHTLAHEQFEHLKATDLLIMDRGYASVLNAKIITNKGAHFLIRCSEEHSNAVIKFSQSSSNDEIIEIELTPRNCGKELTEQDAKIIKVRLIKVKISSTETEILMTSLLDKIEFPRGLFKKLYFMRWGIETFYNKFKSIIEVERFSGTSHQFVQQEFYCAIYLSNMHSILIKDVQEEVVKKYKNRKYEYKINTTSSLGIIRENLIALMLSKKNHNEKLIELQEFFVLNVIPIRPNRSIVRTMNKYMNKTKPKQFHNKRQTF